ncbi:MAG: carbamoyltransferase HypF [Aridibacter sp.]
MTTRTQILVKGIVQGVGFRPYIYSLARSRSLNGQVFNNSNGVLIEVEGNAVSIQNFIDEIKTNPPPLSYIESVEYSNFQDTANYKDFRIIESSSNGEKFTPVSPDVATCEDCLREMFDSNNRRHLYPFINCTNCGPRFTIIKDIPYDRKMTTMHEFEMCSDCRTEYENPLDRRFHAEPTACEKCGPNIWFLSERTRPACNERESVRKNDAILATQNALQNGKIVAIKGIGGFHLACDARNDSALTTLRERKGRVDKPFAVMVKDLETAKKLVEINGAEETILTSKERPIVLLKKKLNNLSELVAPNNHFLGVMLPYSPLHYLLFNSTDNAQTPDVLVMTSGNFSNEPIVKDNDEALEKLLHLADSLLLHNREIYVQCDDSVVRTIRNYELGITNYVLPIRRSRGYAPFPVELPFEVPNILAVGGELKAAFCLTKKNFAFMSQHIGDMENLETLWSFEKSFEQMKALFRVEPEIIACDKHPNYLSSNWARENAEKMDARIFEVQHHHAHIASVMAENSLQNEKVIGFAFDGTGFGDDGNIWGGEVLIADYEGFERAAHLDYFPLAGGDASIKRPYRVALSLLKEAEIEWNEKLGCVSFCTETERKILAKQLEKNLNVIPTSSFGRLFDAVASLANVRQKITYEAQAAIEFEALMDESGTEFYSFELVENDTILINWKNLIQAVAEDILNEMPIPRISAKFHNAVANLILNLSFKMREKFGLNQVALSGGCFQNVALLQKAISLLTANDFEVFTHKKVPPNDGGLALGQAVIASQSKVKVKSKK